jgi:hypothetical protein
MAMENHQEKALNKLPESFRTELSAILHAAKNGGVISPRRHPGLLVDIGRVEKRYAQKLAQLREREKSAAIDKVERAIAGITADVVSTLKA